MTEVHNLAEGTRPFLDYLEAWYRALDELPLRDLVADKPDRVALISVDVINGFCKEGPLASERVDRISRPVADLFERAYALGVRNFVRTQDTHDPNTPEFQSYPPHAIRDTAESEAVPELQALPFFDEITRIPKNSISSSIGTALGNWMAEHTQVNRFVVIGDCTDLCTYQSAMHLRLYANAHNLERRVVVPADAVDTFDIPVAVAREQGTNAHDGDLHHLMFLHHMGMNGVEIVRKLG
ncbi:MAG: cysteine hydrolase family protein [Chloroflexaceae bacterium]